MGAAAHLTAGADVRLLEEHPPAAPCTSPPLASGAVREEVRLKPIDMSSRTPELSLPSAAAGCGLCALPQPPPPGLAPPLSVRGGPSEECRG